MKLGRPIFQSMVHSYGERGFQRMLFGLALWLLSAPALAQDARAPASPEAAAPQRGAPASAEATGGGQPGVGVAEPSLRPGAEVTRDAGVEEPPRATAEPPLADDADPAALTEFSPVLAAHGRWSRHPRYGLVWQPHEAIVGSGFTPYVSAGHWALDAAGDWVWVSDYAFGWVVFHYGRWAWASDAGWLWVPGRRYAPAWVVWRVPTANYAYVGWGPAPPRYVWIDGRAVWLASPPPAPYVFCASARVFAPYPRRHLIHDRALMRRLARGSARYRDVWSRGRWRRGPSPAALRVPAFALPRARVAAHPRALAHARPSAAARGAVLRAPRARAARAAGRASSTPGVSGRRAGRAKPVAKRRRAAPRGATAGEGAEPRRADAAHRARRAVPVERAERRPRGSLRATRRGDRATGRRPARPRAAPRSR